MSTRLALVSTAAASIALMSSTAVASTHTAPGRVQIIESSSNSASTTISGNDFGIGYSASFVAEGFNFDVLPNTVTISKSDPPLPGNVIGTTSTSVTYDVPDVGRLAHVTGSFGLPITFFDDSENLFELNAEVTGSTHASDTAMWEAYVLGSKLDSDTYNLPYAARLGEYCDTLMEVEAEFSMIGIPITLSAAADGCIYVDASLTWASNKLSGTVTPGADVSATLKAGVGVDIFVASFEAGAYGEITVIDASVPLTVSGEIKNTSIIASESAKLTMTGLDGSVGLYAEECGGVWPFEWCNDDTLEIFSWTGMTYGNVGIFSTSQTFSW